MSGGESWSIPEPHRSCLSWSGSLEARIREGSGPWPEIGEAMSSRTGFPTAAFRALLESGDLDVRWPLTFAAWYWFVTGASVNQECASFLSDGRLWEKTCGALLEYTGLPWILAWRSTFERNSLIHAGQRRENLECYALDRGGATLGVVTRGPWDREQGSWREWGWLEPAEGFRGPGRLLEEEERLFEQAVRMESEEAGSEAVLAEAASVQAEFMRPGVALVSLADGGRWTIQEFHLCEGRVYWR